MLLLAVTTSVMPIAISTELDANTRIPLATAAPKNRRGAAAFLGSPSFTTIVRLCDHFYFDDLLGLIDTF